MDGPHSYLEWAWHYKQYNKDKALAKLETKAREAKRGLWSDPNPLPPWEFRHRQNPKEQPEAKVAESAPAKKYWLNTCSNVRHNESCVRGEV